MKIISIINTTTDSMQTARKISECLIKKKLSPCIQIIQEIESLYMWKGEINNSKELLLHIKTLPEYIHECKKNILKLHNYTVPEIIITQAEILEDKYLDWFLSMTSQ